MNRSWVGKMRKTVGCRLHKGGEGNAFGKEADILNFCCKMQLFGIALFVCAFRYNVSFKRS